MVVAIREYALVWDEDNTTDKYRMMPQGFINQGYWKPDNVPQSKQSKHDRAKKKRERWFNPVTQEWQ